MVMAVITGFRKTQPIFLKKAQPAGFYWAFGFFNLNEQLGSLVDSPHQLLAKLLFRFASTSDYLKICKFVIYWSLDAVHIKKSAIITGTTN